jgi:asparagine synthase (glutamine-hydrolysing)
VCGINGILRLNPDKAPIDREELLRTRDAMATRGPDGFGEWNSPSGSIGLGHRRLAIIDLSDTGAQPMPFADGRYRIVYNGEIYNYRELRRDLESEGIRFSSLSDTEVILALYAKERECMLGKLRGMFAFALWDEVEQRLLLARDKFGIKPLYYSLSNGYLRFASQVKALEKGGKVASAPDPAGVVGFLLWGWVPEPFTIRREVRALPAGHFMFAERGRLTAPRSFQSITEDECRPEQSLAAAIENSVRAHLVADVPVAVFLSAGMDSSMITALACRHLPEPPVTLTVRFRSLMGTPLDEGPLAAQIAKSLGTRHVERVIEQSEFPDFFERVVDAMDQPSIDGFNVFVVSSVAREAGLKVVLSGLGGDELLGSYPSFRDVPRWKHWTRFGRFIPGAASIWPNMARGLCPSKPKLAGLFRYGASDAGAYFLRRGLFLPGELPSLLGPKLAAEGLASYDPILAAEACRAAGEDGAQNNGEEDSWRSVHLMETGLYMRNQLLRDADWASMAHSLELRVPLVDSWLIKQAAGMNFEPARSRGKAAALREVAPELPNAVWHRPKSGFVIPVVDWLEAPQASTSKRSFGRDSRMVAASVLEKFVDWGLS